MGACPSKTKIIKCIVPFLRFFCKDVAEDMTDLKTSVEAISRRRQRNEICTSLKRSSIIHHVYIGKNVLEVAIVVFFLPINIGKMRS